MTPTPALIPGPQLTPAMPAPAMHAPTRRSPLLFCVLAAVILVAVSGCATLPSSTSPSPAATAAALEAQARAERSERASAALAMGLKDYEAGNYDNALLSLLQALDSGLLPSAQVTVARKTMAFVHCVSGRAALCRDEFARLLAADASFTLSPAEAGHPLWGPLFRQAKANDEARRSGRPLPEPPRVPSNAEKLLAEGSNAYDKGEFAKALKAFQDALKEQPALSAADELSARKLSAFCYCLTNRMTLCRAEFEKLLANQPDFELAAAEAGHPSWGPSFRSAKQKQKAASKK